MTKENYIKLLTEKVGIEGQKTIDVMQIMRLLLVYNRRFVEKENQGDYDVQCDAKFLDVFVRANQAKAEKDPATIASLSTELLELCEPEVKALFSEAKTFEKGLYDVHSLVMMDMNVPDKQENIRQSRIIADQSMKNDDAKKDYDAQVVKVEQDNFVRYDKATFDALYSKVKGTMSEDLFKQRLEGVIYADTKHLVQLQDKYFPEVVEEIIKEDLRISNTANSTINDERNKK